MTVETYEKALDLQDAIEARANDIDLILEKLEFNINGAKPQTMINISLTLTKERMAKLLETAKKLLEEDKAQYEEEFEKL